MDFQKYQLREKVGRERERDHVINERHLLKLQ